MLIVPSIRSSAALLGAALSVAIGSAAKAQGADSTSAGARRTRAPISIGNYPRVDGVRLNFRDRRLDRVRGINATIWQPHEPATGAVTGLALGLPLTGAGEIHGLALGMLGASASGTIRGIAIGGIGVGSGGGVRGLAIGGIGVGSGGDLEGIAIGGIGAGSGGNATGLVVGGIGAGLGGKLRGIAIGGIGVGAAGGVSGLSIGGIGVGTGGDLTGIMLAGIGAGAGGNVTGLTVSGIGAGAGGTMRGIGIAGIGIGAPKLVGGYLAPTVGALDAHAIVIAPVLFRIEKGGSFRGGSLSAVNYVRGTQRGVSIGLVNYARSLHGVQIGVLNIIADQTSHPFLPIVNWGGGR
ncbi:MAG: hypothetical protein H7099_03545 [Gemmatimonadaceae bacterium]|nr:hypothetical protein [Gemmatimonadaceae bacterium]